jgi:hypothetical protein
MLGWDQWSLALHKFWCQRCADNINSLNYQASLVYWWSKNEYLRLLSTKPFHKANRRKKLTKDAAMLREIAVGSRTEPSDSQLSTNIAKNFTAMYNNFLGYYRKVAGEEEQKRIADSKGAAKDEPEARPG